MPGWPQLSRIEVLRRRLATQRLTTAGPVTAAEVVELLSCVQSQEWAHGFWSLGLRTGPVPGAAGLDHEGVQAEFDRGDILRTHILRPTWHYVAAADVSWILAATSPRVHQRNSGAYRQGSIDAVLRERSGEVILEALTGTALTRSELRERLAAAGIDAAGMQLAHLLMPAELDGLIASGPLRWSSSGSAQHTYRRLDELLAGRELARPEDPVVELLARFLRGHGPATLADFTRWCSLTLSTARTALDRLREREAERLIGAQVHDVDGAPVVWWFADAPEPVPASGRVFVIPLYDELTLSYPKINFEAAAGHPHVPGADLFVGSAILDEAEPSNAGLWHRTVQGRLVQIQVDLASSCTAADHAAAKISANELARFLGKERG